jgi:hypothetical protein
MGPWFEMHLVCLASGLAALSLFLYQSATLYRASAPTLSLPLPADLPIHFFRFSGGGRGPVNVYVKPHGRRY